MAISQFLPTHTPIQAQGPTPLRKLRGLRPFYPPTPFRYASRIYDQRCAGGGCENHPLRERSDRMGEGPRAQRTGVWVIFVLPPWPYADTLPGSTPDTLRAR